MRHRMRPAQRAGFTIVELLVVIAIIAVIASLSIGAVFTLRESQTKNFAEANVQKLASALEQQWKAVLDQAHDDSVPEWALRLAANDRRRARVIFLKARLRQEFPISIPQARTDLVFSSIGANVPAKATYSQALSGLPVGFDPAWGSSAILYMVLTQSRRGMAATAPDALVDGSAIRSESVTLVPPFSGTKTFTFFVDGWGNPLRFFVFPTGNDEINQEPYIRTQTPNSPGPPLPYNVARDVQDPEDTLISAAWPIALRNDFQANLHTLTNAIPQRHLIPVVASSGKDGLWGLNLTTMAITTTNDVGDNIYSYRLRRFGARGD